MRRGSLKSFSAILFCAILSAFSLAGLANQQKKREAQPPQPEADVRAEQAEAVITTVLGVFRFEFFSDKAPKHTAGFIQLARSGFYDGSAFHRLLPRAIIQGGDPLLKDPQTPRARWG